MKIDIFARQVQTLNDRLAKLYQGAASSSPPVEHLLSNAFMELGMVSEELQVALEELCQQNEELALSQIELEAQRQRYQELFEFAPDAYLVTDTGGKIIEANRAAAALLNVSQQHLIGKPLVVFISAEQRWNFRSELNRKQCSEVQNWEVRLQPRHRPSFDAVLTVATKRDRADKATTCRWLLRDISQNKRVTIAPQIENNNGKRDREALASANHLIHIYCKGEIIPLQPETIWQVRQGLVKLTTVNETGEDVLLGLAGAQISFGSGLTSLLTYQATAISERVELVEFSLKEVEDSPDLAQILLPQMIQRLRQGELMLTIFGKRRIQDRLQQLLLILQREIGEETSNGIRLSVRLTHADLANACGTTRVTMTRILKELQQQGKIRFDRDRHIVINY